MQSLTQLAATRIKKPGDTDGLIDAYEKVTARNYTGGVYIEFENGIQTSDITTMPALNKDYTAEALQKLELELKQMEANATKHEETAAGLEAKKRFSEVEHYYSAADSARKRAEGIRQTLEIRKENMQNVVEQYCKELEDYIKEVQRIFIDPAVEIIKSHHVDPDGKKRRPAAAEVL